MKAALERLGLDLAKIATRRWLEASMLDAFHLGPTGQPIRFDPLTWLRDDRPRLRMGAGFAAYEVTFWDGERRP